jgi:hypothetical protein
MSSLGYRLEDALTGIELAPEGRRSLRILPAGTILLVTDENPPADMKRVLANEREYLVFARDLEERSTLIAVDLRKPVAVAATADAGATYRWAN